jgi:hypothetical protein
MICYMLYHGDVWKAESMSLAWVKGDAMWFHGSRHARDVFILPRNI